MLLPVVVVVFCRRDGGKRSALVGQPLHGGVNERQQSAVPDDEKRQGEGGQRTDAETGGRTARRGYARQRGLRSQQALDANAEVAVGAYQRADYGRLLRRTREPRDAHQRLGQGDGEVRLAGDCAIVGSPLGQADPLGFEVA